MADQHGPQSTEMTGEPFGPGPSDVVILPLVTIALAVRKILRAIFRALIHVIDWLFPILLQVMRFPLFTLRILGDGIAVLVKAAMWLLPLGGPRRAAWRERVSEYWAWLRAKISYRAFEEWLHHAFENGMAWVFKRCKSLTPRGAVFVLIGAVLWLPISFGAATGLHALLFAKALVWPAWMQLLHPFATVIAKSKLLVLPVYPAAWPQAKRDPIVQALLRFGQFLGTLYLVRKAAYRYRQMDHAAAAAGEWLKRAAAFVGLTQLGTLLLAGINGAALWLGNTARAVAARTIEILAKAPLLGPILQRYMAQYDAVNRAPSAPLSERTRNFFTRWSEKFTVEYYEAKEREEAAKGHASA